MSGAFNSHKKRIKPSINITSLIDVMFLLLIFFMVSSTFRQQMGIEVTLPEAETASSLKVEQHEITVDKTGQMFFDGKMVDRTDLRTALKKVVDSKPDATIVLKADKEANFGSVVSAIDIARSVGGTKLIIPTEFVEDIGEPLKKSNPEN